jgi:L-lysine exporter family protein LysE/ArgO
MSWIDVHSGRSVGRVLGFTALAAGFAFGLSLIVAIGAQNTFVLRQGLRREHVLTVVAICTVSDVVLIAAGVAGAGTAVTHAPELLRWVRIGGAALLFGYAVLAARRALRPAEPAVTAAGGRTSRGGVLAACLGFTWLNPAVYLDTVVLLGSVAAGRPGHQWWFGAGAAGASVLWFAAIGFGARLLTPLFSKARAGQALEAFVAVVMALTALRLLLG